MEPTPPPTIDDPPPDDGEEVPVCVGCFTPFEPNTDYCENCGTVVGQTTEYMPFANIRWMTTGYARALDRIGAPDTNLLVKIGSVLALFIIWPILLILLPFRWLAEDRAKRDAARAQAADPVPPPDLAETPPRDRDDG